jgi:pimeloyl-ACP methyl ester carboxylesterase
MTASAQPTAVLVHGAWHGAWCFERVLDGLRDAGMPAIAVDLPGHGDDPGPLTDLHGDADRVREVLDGIDGDCILLGHSYGGAVITEAGVHPAVRHLVYLCAFNLDGSEACMTTAIEEAAAAGISWETQADPGLVEHADGTLTITNAAASFYNDCDGQTVAWALARLGPQPTVTLQQQPAAVAWRERPSTYVVCTDDRGPHPDLQRILARRCTNVVEWPTSHSPFFSAPERVVDLLVRIGAALPPRPRLAR